MAEPTGVETPADDAAYFTEEFAEEPFDAEAGPSEYTTESTDAAAPRAARRPVVTGHANGTGRRKEAVARVRIVPGTGQWKINGSATPPSWVSRLNRLSGVFPAHAHPHG